MATNPFFRNSKKEQNLVNDLTIETIKAMGRDVIYIPRDYLIIDNLFGEDPESKFSQGYPLEMYLVDVEKFQGNRDVIAKFGIQITDRTTFVLSKTRFEQEVYTHRNEIKKPREGDLIFLPLSGSLFEINYVEDENPFYQHGALTTYVLSCELFTYSGEEINTGISTIDIIEDERTSFALLFPLTTPVLGNTSDLLTGELVYQVFGLSGAGATLSNATATAEALRFIRGSTLSHLYVSGASGTISVTGGNSIKGSVSGSEYITLGSVETTNIIIPIDPNTETPVIDNNELQSKGIDIFDFTDIDPFSEGRY